MSRGLQAKMGSSQEQKIGKSREQKSIWAENKNEYELRAKMCRSWEQSFFCNTSFVFFLLLWSDFKWMDSVHTQCVFRTLYILKTQRVTKDIQIGLLPTINDDHLIDMCNSLSTKGTRVQNILKILKFISHIFLTKDILPEHKIGYQINTTKIDHFEHMWSAQSQGCAHVVRFQNVSKSTEQSVIGTTLATCQCFGVYDFKGLHWMFIEVHITCRIF